MFSFIWLQCSEKRYKYGTKIRAESLVQQVRKPCIYFDLWVQLLAVFLFLKSRNMIYSIFKPNKNADLYQNCTCLKLFLFWKKKGWPHQFSGALRKCWNWDWSEGFGSLHWWWLSVLCTWCAWSLQGEWGLGQEMLVTSSWITWLLFVLQKFYLKSSCGKAKETNSWFESKRTNLNAALVMRGVIMLTLNK